jgi:hypothetical protein
MRRPGHIRLRSPGSFELRYSLGTDPASGERRVATTTVKGTRQAAEKELRRLLRRVDTGEQVDPQSHNRARMAHDLAHRGSRRSSAEIARAVRRDRSKFSRARARQHAATQARAKPHSRSIQVPGRMAAWRASKKNGLFWLSQLSGMLELP